MLKNKRFTEEERLMIEQERRLSLYEYYGLEFGVIVDPPDGEVKMYETEEEIDKEAARMYILQGVDIPRDLADRLLKYKANDPKIQEREKRIEERFEKYGLVSYLGWDDDIVKEETPIQEMIDVSTAIQLIREDKPIPKDLGERLLEYEKSRKKME